MAAMGVAGGGRNDVDSRFISLFTVVNLLFPLDSTLKHIYGSILKGHLQDFPDLFLVAAGRIVQMTLSLFKIISVELPPTPSKFHYIFNLKDLSRTYSGLCLTHPSIFQDPKQLVRVWRNEFLRVFCDRLNSQENIDLMNKNLKIELLKCFPDLLRKRPSLITLKSQAGTASDALVDMQTHEYVLRNPILFGDYRHGIVDEDERFYEDLLDYGVNIKIEFFLY